MSKQRLYWFEGRNTPVVAKTSSEAKSKLKRAKSDKIVKSRNPTESEAKTIASGRWVTTRPDDKPRGSSKIAGKGMYGKKSGTTKK